MADPTPETLEFKSELRQILHIITHSLYSHKDVFLRELISNASDAIDKIRFNSLTNEAILEGDREWRIKLIQDKSSGTLTVSDNGIGMSREAIVDNLGTIAKSGTKAFLESLTQADARNKPELIGQFGVGFYSAFMVADRVTVVSRMAGDPSQGVRWSSDGQGEFTVETTPKPSRGTDVILHLKAEEKEFLESWKLQSMVKQFSDFIEHPIVMDVEKEDEKKVKSVSEETLNSRKALWLRSKSDVTPEEYNAFYQQMSNDFTDPLRIIHYTGEGTTEFKVLLFIPARKPFELQFGEAKVGPRLYIRRVLIMDHCESLLPPYLRFVKGVVDCADLPLNISREMLQQNPLLEKIQKNIVKNVLKALDEMKRTETDRYAAFFKELGSILKEGISRDRTNQEQIADLMLFESLKTEPTKLTSLGDYVSGMPPEQEEIYYLAGETRGHLERAPYLEVLKEKGWDVLLLTDPIDEFVIPALPEYKGKKLKAADRADLEADTATKTKNAGIQDSFANLFTALMAKIDGIKDIRLSTRLKESASCLVSEEGAMGANMEHLLQKLGHAGDAPGSKRVLELNPDHPAVIALKAIHTANGDDHRVELYGRLLYEEAVIAEGSKLKDPAAFARRLNELLVRDAGIPM